MDIKIIEKHKSINPSCDFNLPDFSVLTGKNGSGKTHLLEAMADKKISNFINGNLIKNVRYIGFNNLNPTIEETCDPNSIIQHIKNTWNNYNNARQNVLREAVNYHNLNRLYQHNSDVNFKIYVDKTIEGTKKIGIN